MHLEGHTRTILIRGITLLSLWVSILYMDWGVSEVSVLSRSMSQPGYLLSKSYCIFSNCIALKPGAIHRMFMIEESREM